MGGPSGRVSEWQGIKRFGCHGFRWEDTQSTLTFGDELLETEHVAQRWVRRVGFPAAVAFESFRFK